MSDISVGAPAQIAIQNALDRAPSSGKDVEMISGNNGRNVQGILSGGDGGRGGDGFEFSRELTDNINKHGLEAVIDMSSRANDLSPEEIETLQEFKKDIDAGNDAAHNDKTDQTALLVDENGLIAKVASHSEIASQIDGTGARDLGGAHSHDTVAGESVGFDATTSIGANEYRVTEQFNIKSNQFWSPLALDLEGDGVSTTDETIQYDINGNGQLNTINDVEGVILAMGDGDDGSELLGNNTDLGLGKDYANGFEALRTLAEQYDLVGGDDQTLDRADLNTLEEKEDLGVKTDGYLSETQSFGQVGVSQINLGEQGNTQWQSNFDGQGNAVETQEGATFVNDDGEVNDYVDVWHRNA